MQRRIIITRRELGEDQTEKPRSKELGSAVARRAVWSSRRVMGNTIPPPPTNQHPPAYTKQGRRTEPEVEHGSAGHSKGTNISIEIWGNQGTQLPTSEKPKKPQGEAKATIKPTRENIDLAAHHHHPKLLGICMLGKPDRISPSSKGYPACRCGSTVQKDLDWYNNKYI